MRIGTILWNIYALTEPDGVTVRYVGITRARLSTRLTRHICDARTKGEGNHRCCWLRALARQGLRPSIYLLEQTANLERERYWIHRLRDQGASLTNASDGCESNVGYMPPAKVRESVGRAHKGTKMPPQTRQALLHANLGRVMSAATRAALQNTTKNRVFSAETRARIGAAGIGRPSATKGVPKTTEQRIKISASLTGKVQSEESRRKRSEALTGRTGWNKGIPWTPARRTANEARRQRKVDA